MLLFVLILMFDVSHSRCWKVVGRSPSACYFLFSELAYNTDGKLGCLVEHIIFAVINVTKVCLCLFKIIHFQSYF